MPDDDGIFAYLYIYWSNGERIARLKNYVETVDTPYIEDSLLEEIVYEAGIDYMQGSIGLEEAVNKIEKKVSILMAE